MRLDNKVAVITGSGRGIGKAIAVAFAKEGCNIVINYRSDERAAVATAEEIRKYDVVVSTYKADVTNRIDIKKMLGFFEELQG